MPPNQKTIELREVEDPQVLKDALLQGVTTVDLRGVERLDLARLQCLVAAHRSLPAIVLVNASPEVETQLSGLGLLELLEPAAVLAA